MATDNNANDVRMRHMNSKTSNIVVYVNADGDDERDMAVNLGGDIYSETEIERDDTVKVGLGGNVTTLWTADYSDLPRSDTGDVTVRVDRKTERVHKYDTDKIIDDRVADKLKDTVQRLGDELGFRYWNYNLKDDDHNVKVRTTMSGFSRMGLIHHKPDVEQGMVWEDEDAGLWAFTITVKCEDTSENTIFMTDSNLIDHMVGWLNEQDWVMTARKRACEVEQTERGDCYNVFN